MARNFESLRDVFALLPPDGRARDLIRKFNLAVDGKARSVKGLAIALGFDVVERDDLGRVSGRLVRDAFAENGYRIEVNSRHSVQAKRWAVLHEIAHFYQHMDHDDPFAEPVAFDASGETFYLDPSEEREANSFAEAVLFGDGALKAALTLHGRNIERVARQFGVSVRVVQIAMRRFG